LLPFAVVVFSLANAYADLVNPAKDMSVAFSPPRPNRVRLIVWFIQYFHRLPHPSPLSLPSDSPPFPSSLFLSPSSANGYTDPAKSRAIATKLSTSARLALPLDLRRTSVAWRCVSLFLLLPAPSLVIPPSVLYAF
jgi:hypothetical protein